MQLLSEMDLPRLPVESPEFDEDPFRFADEARLQHPWLAKYSQGYIVHGYQACRDLAMMDDKLQMSFSGHINFYEAHGTPWAQFMDEMLMTSSGARHKRLRDSVAAGFTPRRANQIRPMMQRIINELLDEWAPKGEFDFSDFAANYPISVMCGLLGISTEALPGLRQGMDDHMDSLAFDASLKPAFMVGYDRVLQFARGIIAANEPREDGEEGAELFTMLKAKKAGLMDETETEFMLLTFLFGGYDTSKNMLTVTMKTLLDYPGIWNRCAENVAYAGKVIDEMLRYSAIATLFRDVVEDFEYDGILFPKGTLVTFAFPLSGRDPAAFPDPWKFDPDRVQGNRHLAFGRGQHMCIGQYIAKALLQEGLHIIAQRLAKPRLAGKPIAKPLLGSWGYAVLPIAFEPKPARARLSAEAAG